MGRTISPEVRAARSERMKQFNAQKKGLAPTLTAANGQQAKAVWFVAVNVDWQNLPLLDAQQAYATLQKCYQQAGVILNARSNDRGDFFSCFICDTKHARPARYVNNAYKAPDSDIIRKVECCGEVCAMKFEQRLIEERRSRLIVEREVNGS